MPTQAESKLAPHRRDTFLIVCCSNFGNRFHVAAQGLKMKTILDGFDSSMIEIRNEDWKCFIEELAGLQW